MALKIRSMFWRMVFDATYWLYTKTPEGGVWEVYLFNLCNSIVKKGRLIDE